MSYRKMSLKSIEPYIPEMERLKVSEVARSRRGFLYNYLKYGNDVFDRKVFNATITWDDKRNAFIARHLPSYMEKPTYRRWLALVAWAFKPPVLHSKEDKK